ncbi:MAG: DUF192 domain-containing protein [bacterium]|nr:DUF192 domain-containing protein [bacterium]
MKKVILIIVIFIVSGCATQETIINTSEQTASDISQVCFDQTCFNAEIADNGAERALGLMNREYLAPENGMLFVFESGAVYKFWMKNTLIPLDIIWLNEDKRVVYINEHTPPCLPGEVPLSGTEWDGGQITCPTYGPDEPALYVLEINGGAAAENNIDINSPAVFR